MSEIRPTLVIMAAGLGTRYGEGKIKQLDPIGPNGEIIIDYSIYDAKTAGFGKVVFIIREDIKEAFDKMIGDRIAKHIDTECVYQNVKDVPDEFSYIERSKPWGTAHAVLACRNVVKEPFTVINADDSYGRQAYADMHDFLVGSAAETDDKLHLAMPGFIVENTLSDIGDVTRGVCDVGDDGMLRGITETYGIGRHDGKITALKSKFTDDRRELSPDTHVSMNMWACPAGFIDKLESRFAAFLKIHKDKPDAEFLLPRVIDKMIKNSEADCRMFETNDKWFGVTSLNDKETVRKAIAALTEQGVYPEKLWG